MSALMVEMMSAMEESQELLAESRATMSRMRGELEVLRGTVITQELLLKQNEAESKIKEMRISQLESSVKTQQDTIEMQQIIAAQKELLDMTGK